MDRASLKSLVAAMQYAAAKREQYYSDKLDEFEQDRDKTIPQAARSQHFFWADAVQFLSDVSRHI
jgi:hypothetical protein